MRYRLLVGVVLGAASLLAGSCTCGVVTDLCMDEDVDCWEQHLRVEVDGKTADLTEEDSPAATQPADGGTRNPSTDQLLLFIVGADGGIWRSDNRATERMASPTNATLSSVWGSGPQDFWAVGDTTRLHYDGSGWTAMSPSPVPLHAVWGSGPNDVWFGGNGSLFHWDGSGSFSEVAFGTGAVFRAIGGSAANDVWAVGDVGMAFHFDGTSWTARNTAQSYSLRAVRVIDPQHVVFGTTLGLLVWNGTFTRYDSIAGVGGLHGTGQQWFGVDDNGNALLGDLTVFNGSGASAEPTGASSLHGVFTDGHDIFAVGQAGAFVQSAISPRMGWSAQVLGSDNLLSVYGVRFNPSSGGGGGGGPSVVYLPSITNTPGAIEVQPKTFEYSKIPVEWSDPGANCGACTPQICLMTCIRSGPGASPRCSAKSKCTHGVKDGLLGGKLTLGVRYDAIPVSGSVQTDTGVYPRTPECACGGPVPTGAPVFTPTKIFIPDEGSSAGGGSGGGSGSCEHCVSGQACSACSGHISCAGRVCCPTGETCDGTSCVSASGNGGTLAVSIAECGVGRYTVHCSQGGCCPTCMTCNSDGTCSLP